MFTLEKYLSIQPGDNYASVKDLLGSDGEAIVDTGTMKQSKWTNKDQSSISVTFNDDKVVGKTQDRLGPQLKDTQAVKQSQYNQLKEGMDLSEVTNILGEGTEMMLNVVENGEASITYIWQNRDGGNIMVTVKDGKVTKLADMMLK
ncbi:MAG: DUF3862 domain-containing protein [Smithella sp.]